MSLCNMACPLNYSDFPEKYLLPSWMRLQTGLQEKAMKTKTITPTLSSSSSASRTSTSWETASRKCWKVKTRFYWSDSLRSGCRSARRDSVCEENGFVFRHRLIRVCRFSTCTNVEQDPVLPLWLSHAFMQTGHCCTWTLNEPTREFLSTVLGGSS